MTNTAYLKETRKKAVATTLEASETVTSLSSRFNEISERFATMSQMVIEHLENNQSGDKEEVRKLWHDLNSVEHLIVQFSSHTQEAIDEFQTSSVELIKTLQESRTRNF